MIEIHVGRPVEHWRDCYPNCRNDNQLSGLSFSTDELRLKGSAPLF